MPHSKEFADKKNKSLDSWSLGGHRFMCQVGHCEDGTMENWVYWVVLKLYMNSKNAAPVIQKVKVHLNKLSWWNCCSHSLKLLERPEQDPVDMSDMLTMHEFLIMVNGVKTYFGTIMEKIFSSTQGCFHRVPLSLKASHMAVALLTGGAGQHPTRHHSNFLLVYQPSQKTATNLVLFVR